MLLDTDVMVDILRGHPPALNWLAVSGEIAIALPGLYSARLFVKRPRNPLARAF